MTQRPFQIFFFAVGGTICMLVLLIGLLSLGGRHSDHKAQQLTALRQQIVTFDDNIDLAKGLLSDISKNSLIQQDYDSLSIYDQANLASSFFQQFPSEPFIHSVYVYFYKSQKILTNDIAQGTHYALSAEQFYDYPWIQEIMSRKKSVLMPLSENVRDLHIWPNSFRVITLYYEYPQIATPKTGMVVLNIDCEKLFAQTQPAESFLVLDAHGRTIYGSEDVLATVRQTDDDLYDRIMDPNDNHFTASLAQGRTLVKTTSPKLGWMYVQVTDDSMWIGQNWLVTLLAVLLILLAFAVLWCFAAKRLYRLIGKCTNMLFARSDTLKELVLALATGDVSIAQRVTEKLTRQGFPLEKRSLAVLVAKLVDPNRKTLDYSVLHRMRTAAKTILGSMASPNVSILLFDMDNEQLMGLLSYDCDLDTITEQTSLLRQKLEQEQGINLVVGIGNSCDYLADISLSYNEALEAMDYALFHNDGTVVHASSLPTIKSEAPYHYPDDVERQLLAAIKAEDLDAAYAVVDDILSTLPQSYLLSRYVMEKLWKSVGNVLHSLEELGITYEAVFDNTFFEKYREYNACGTTDGMADYLKQDIATLIHYMSANRNNKNKELITTINQYIQVHYKEDLTLNSIARVVYLTPAYISSFYKENTGENISNYIMQVRMENAKRLLATTDLKVNDIAAEVGYTNTRSFLRAFKNYTGLTTGEFRSNAR